MSMAEEAYAYGFLVRCFCTTSAQNTIKHQDSCRRVSVKDCMNAKWFFLLQLLSDRGSLAPIQYNIINYRYSEIPQMEPLRGFWKHAYNHHPGHYQQ